MKYMKTGRMKGQAFVTFSTEEEASEALHELNGYVLHSKPLVVVSFPIYSQYELHTHSMCVCSTYIYTSSMLAI